MIKIRNRNTTFGKHIPRQKADTRKPKDSWSKHLIDENDQTDTVIQSWYTNTAARFLHLARATGRPIMFLHATQFSTTLFH